MSKSNARTRRYAFMYQRAEGNHSHELLWHSSIIPHLGTDDSAEDIKFLSRLGAGEARDAFLQMVPVEQRSAAERSIPLHTAIGVVDRRAIARRIKDKLQAGTGSHWTIRIVEFGGFDRTTRPVKHWNIERKYRMRGQKVWQADTRPYLTGIAVREDARKQARELTESFNDNIMGGEYKLTAVAVYA